MENGRPSAARWVDGGGGGEEGIARWVDGKAKCCEMGRQVW